MNAGVDPRAASVNRAGDLGYCGRARTDPLSPVPAAMVDIDGGSRSALDRLCDAANGVLFRGRRGSR
jgi:hypothetical protein